MKKSSALPCSHAVLVMLVILALLGATLTPGRATPPNDDLANAQVIPSGSSFSVDGDDAGATEESFEKASSYPVPFPEGIWYSWTPSVSGVFDAFSFHPSDGDYSLIGVFKGPGTPSASTYLVSTNIATGVLAPTDVTAGQQYFIFLGNKVGSPFSFSGKVTPQASQKPVVTAKVLAPEAIRSTGAAAKIEFELSAAQKTALTVQYKIGGTAVNGADYHLLSDTVSLPAGVTTVVIKIKAQKGSSGIGTVKLTLVPAPGYTVGSPAVAKIRVVKKS